MTHRLIQENGGALTNTVSPALAFENSTDANCSSTALLLFIQPEKPINRKETHSNESTHRTSHRPGEAHSSQSDQTYNYIN